MQKNLPDSKPWFYFQTLCTSIEHFQTVGTRSLYVQGQNAFWDCVDWRNSVLNSVNRINSYSKRVSQENLDSNRVDQKTMDSNSVDRRKANSDRVNQKFEFQTVWTKNLDSESVDRRNLVSDKSDQRNQVSDSVEKKFEFRPCGPRVCSDRWDQIMVSSECVGQKAFSVCVGWRNPVLDRVNRINSDLNSVNQTKLRFKPCGPKTSGFK